MSNTKSTIKIEIPLNMVGSCGRCSEERPLVRNPRGGVARCMPCRLLDDDEHTHPLKTVSSSFEAVLRGEKKFEYRKDDRGFEVGDVLQLREIPDDNPDIYTGRIKLVRVTHILRGEFAEKFGVTPGYAVLSIEEVLIEEADEMNESRALIEVMAAVIRNGVPREMQLSFIVGVPVGVLAAGGRSEAEIRTFVDNAVKGALIGATMPEEQPS